MNFNWSFFTFILSDYDRILKKKFFVRNYNRIYWARKYYNVSTECWNILERMKINLPVNVDSLEQRDSRWVNKKPRYNSVGEKCNQEREAETPVFGKCFIFVLRMDCLNKNSFLSSQKVDKSKKLSVQARGSAVRNQNQRGGILNHRVLDSKLQYQDSVMERDVISAPSQPAA